jgi:hypothetical protein
MDDYHLIAYPPSIVVLDALFSMPLQGVIRVNVHDGNLDDVSLHVLFYCDPRYGFRCQSRTDKELSRGFIGYNVLMVLGTTPGGTI